MPHKFTYSLLFVLISWNIISQVDSTSIAQHSYDLYDQGKEAYYDGEYGLAQIKFDSCLLLRKQIYSIPAVQLMKAFHRKGKNLIKLNKLNAGILHLDSAQMNAIGLYGSESEILAGILMDKGTAHSKLYNLNTAQELFDQSVNIYQKLKGRESIQAAGALMNSALNKYKYGNYRAAIEDYNYIIRVFEKGLEPDHQDFNRVYLNLSLALRKQGDLLSALRYAERALEIKLKNYAPDHPSVAKYYSNLGKLQSKIGQINQAKKSYNSGLSIYEKRYGKDHLQYLKEQIEIANVLLDDDHLDDALQIYYEVEQKMKSLVNENPRSEAVLNYNICLINIEKRNLEKAFSYLNKLEENIAETPGLERILKLEYYLIRATFYELIGESEIALESLEDLETILIEEGYTDSKLILIAAKYDKAKLYKKQGSIDDLKKASVIIEEAIATIVDVRKYYLSSSSRDYLNEKMGFVFALNVELKSNIYNLSPNYTSANNLNIAIDQAKSARFWDNVLYENSFVGIKRAEHIVSDIERLKDQIASKEYELQRLDTKDNNAEDSLLNLKNALASKYNELEDYGSSNPIFQFHLSNINIDQIQKNLEKDKAILNYYLGDDQITLVVICQDSFKVIRHQIEQRFIDKIELQQISLFSENLTDPITSSLMPENLLNFLDDQRISRIVVIPDKQLANVSFESIRHPKTLNYLLYDYAFSYSNLSLDITQPKRKAKIDYIGFAPDWSGDEQSLYASRSDLVQLPGAKNEIKHTSKILKGKAELSGNALEESFKAQISNKSIVHIASHAQIDLENESNSCIYFSEYSKNDTIKTQDGKLFLDEIMAMDLNTELLVLSACNTGTGKFLTGEGIMSHSRVFNYAGVKSILMSLWLSNDKSASPIVQSFAKNLSKGMKKDIALQQAKIKYLASADPLLSDPYYWSGFVLLGDTVEFKKQRRFLIPGLIILGLGIGAFMMKRNKNPDESI